MSILRHRYRPFARDCRDGDEHHCVDAAGFAARLGTCSRKGSAPRIAAMLRFVIQGVGLALAILTGNLLCLYAGFFLYGIGLGGNMVLPDCSGPTILAGSRSAKFAVWAC